MNALIQRGLLDEVHIYLDPVMRGTGRPLFSGAGVRLRRRRTEDLSYGMVHLAYTVER